MRLKDKVALITGAGSGIGRETALLFASEGARVVVVDVNDAGGQAVAEEARGSGGEAVYVHADVSQSAEAELMIRAAEASFGRLDVLFNNAGISHPNEDRKSTRLNSSHGYISYAVFCLKKKKKTESMNSTH